ncbi:uncharacterized protein LOC124537747 [Vanessa cardui]|uniref:uncharacterized protein LOC124537747 n=1 Tax=Vanessa cardui TaxID=171605 RepID=UPI001F12A396|nr:uncharacterized protein LOC124537747 [Vanessa cardui]
MSMVDPDLLIHSSEESRTCSARSEESLVNVAKNAYADDTNKCEHFAFCKSCQSRVARLREKYKRKRIKVDENSKSMDANNTNVSSFMQNIGILEKSMIDEMFQQLKTVYDAEMDMIRDEKEKKMKRSIANHALQLQKYREELEQSFSARRAELAHSARRRQRFLCELAHRLAHAQKHLAQEEQKLKIQMQEAETALIKKGEEMRQQISEELAILQSHLETVKREREDINRERMELEKLKQIYNNFNMLKERSSKENEDMISNYNLLRDEVVTLRKYIEANKLSTCLVERGVVTDASDGVKGLMNNESAGGCKSDDERLKVNQVVNDLKKRKNVNFNQQPNSEDACSEVTRHHSAVSTDDIRSQIDTVTIQQLKDENDRLKIFSRQQSELIERLSRERRASPHERAGPLPFRVDRGPDELGVQSRVLFPGDTIPFIGVVGNRQRDESRRVLSQWRSLSRQPGADIHVQPNTSAVITENTEVLSDGQTASSPHAVCGESPNSKLPSAIHGKIHEKSPKSVKREAKQTLRDKTVLSSAVSDKSSDETIREAKRRLRKLEIEAEAVEKSYLDYRIRQTALSKENTDSILDDVKKIGKKKTNSLEKLDQNSKISDNFVYKDNFDNKQNKQEAYYTDNIEDFKQKTVKDNETKLPLKIDSQKHKADEENKKQDEDLMNERKFNVDVEKENLVKTIEIIEQKSIKDIEHEEIEKEIKNLLLVEVENVCATANIGATASDQDLLVVVQSSVDSNELVLPDIDKEKISTQMTILVSPKSDSKEVENKTNNLSPEIAKLTDNDALNSIYHTDVNLMSSIDMPLNKIDFIGDIERGSPDYPDDFSADVDNYNSQSDYGKNSPISLPKTSEDDSFWD